MQTHTKISRQRTSFQRKAPPPQLLAKWERNQYLIQPLIKKRMIYSFAEPSLVATTALEGSVSFNTQMIKLLLSRKVIGRMENGKNMGAHTIGNLQAGFVCQCCANSLNFSHCHFHWWFVNCQTKEICLSDNGEAADTEASNSHPRAPPSEDTDISASPLVGRNKDRGTEKQ